MVVGPGTSQTRSNAVTTSPIQPSSTAETPTSETDGSAWSAAIGGAKNGKSGRVIERLMGENDRLQREKTLACAQRDEECKRSELARSALESARTSNQYLASIHETDQSLILRKERKIEELREELDNEKSKRAQAEAKAKATQLECDVIVQKLTQEATEDRERSRRSTAQYEVLSKSWKSQEGKYERQTQKLKASFKAFRDEMAEDKQKMSRIEVVMEQLRQENDKTRRAYESLVREFETYKLEQEQGVHGMREAAARSEAMTDGLLNNMNTVLGEMKHVMNVKRDTRETEAGKTGFDG